MVMCLFDLSIFEIFLPQHSFAVGLQSKKIGQLMKCVSFTLVTSKFECSHNAPFIISDTTSCDTHTKVSRATRSTFLAGFPIAFFSGCGVAISVVDESTSSLVGVAISASLLPPAGEVCFVRSFVFVWYLDLSFVSSQLQVNSGMLWLMAFYEDPSYVDFSFSIGYDAKDYSVMGTFSLLLTIANVVMVCVGATLMFRVKEVLPVTKKVFWEDLKVARQILQGRAYDSVTGEALRAEHLTEQLSQVVLS